ncbi:glycosyltransferase family 2 protein [Paracidovorax anthurii]|uniref:Glycosyltransferase involved in cell wall biosynthesis n=1 Tax=Paracidovorax anthurii TaxID=78229 RepID=A0A328YV06_9BURK|nr:glycosyltransferase family 2 protein [Paracidovorax anthurii]RAR76963.1 glycosyltransferase involved in cell wall biosynthesis [Paracidovorax anthurii]
MAHNKPLITVVIATFNSEKLLPMVVGALRKQSYPQDAIEVLAVDGGSKDRTRTMAEMMGCKVIDNPLTEPVHAKYLGFMAARGKYLMYLDHDEELVNPRALEEVVSTFQKFPDVRTVDSSGYINPPGYSLVNEYINDFGEPFSFFMYRQSRSYGFHLSAIASRAKVVADGAYALVFPPSPSNKKLFIENLAAGVVTDLDFVRGHVSIGRSQDLCHLFFTLNGMGQSFAVAKHNPLRHYSGDTWRKFLTKIEWRIKNNVYHLEGVGAAGFHGRQSHQPQRMKIKKFLFLPYAVSVIFPLMDGIWLAATRKRWLYLVHPLLTIYTAWQICRHMFLKALGYRPQMTSYDGKSTIGAK